MQKATNTPLVHDPTQRAIWLLLRRHLYGLLAAIDEVFGIDHRHIKVRVLRQEDTTK